MAKAQLLPRYSCKRCEHDWIPRRDAVPTICPKCKSPYWNREREIRESKEDKSDVR